MSGIGVAKKGVAMSMTERPVLQPTAAHPITITPTVAAKNSVMPALSVGGGPAGALTGGRAAAGQRLAGQFIGSLASESKESPS